MDNKKIDLLNTIARQMFEAERLGDTERATGLKKAFEEVRAELLKGGK